MFMIVLDSFFPSHGSLIFDWLGFEDSVLYIYIKFFLVLFKLVGICSHINGTFLNTINYYHFIKPSI